MDENTTHECPICGDIHLPPSKDEAAKDENSFYPWPVGSRNFKDWLGTLRGLGLAI